MEDFQFELQTSNWDDEKRFKIIVNGKTIVEKVLITFFLVFCSLYLKSAQNAAQIVEKLVFGDEITIRDFKIVNHEDSHLGNIRLDVCEPINSCFVKGDIEAMCQIQDGQEKCFCPNGYFGDGKTTEWVLSDLSKEFFLERNLIEPKRALGAST